MLLLLQLLLLLLLVENVNGDVLLGILLHRGHLRYRRLMGAREKGVTLEHAGGKLNPSGPQLTPLLPHNRIILLPRKQTLLQIGSVQHQLLLEPTQDSLLMTLKFRGDTTPGKTQQSSRERSVAVLVHKGVQSIIDSL